MKRAMLCVGIGLLVTGLFGGCRALLRGSRVALYADSAQQAEQLTAICMAAGFDQLAPTVGSRRRSVLWRAPAGPWVRGAILVLHGGGGAHYDFCAPRRLTRPQVDLVRMAIDRGFAVFLLDATTDVVTDAGGRPCGKRFDFSVLDRPNVDLPLARALLDQELPRLRPDGSAADVFVTGLSTGGYMTTRVGTELAAQITAFAPVAAGDPYSTETDCDPTLSRRQSAKGVLRDVDTGRQITEVGACTETESKVAREPDLAPADPLPHVKQLHHENDGIVDLSCMQKNTRRLRARGHRVEAPYLARGGRRRALVHLWREEYNAEIVDFFERAAEDRAGSLADASRSGEPEG